MSCVTLHHFLLGSGSQISFPKAPSYRQHPVPPPPPTTWPELPSTRPRPPQSIWHRYSPGLGLSLLCFVPSSEQSRGGRPAQSSEDLCGPELMGLGFVKWAQ